MKTIGLIFPHQLFDKHPVLEHTDEVYLVEDSLFFGDKHNPLKFHKQKLVFHRATMQAYKKTLELQGVTVHYIEYQPTLTITDTIKDIIPANVICVDPTDYLLERRIKRSIPELTFLDSPLFINTRQDNRDYLSKGKLFMQEFYKFQRTRLDILMTDGKPTGGKWSFDEANRKKIPRSHYSEIPIEPPQNNNAFITEAKKYIQEKFPKNYGSLEYFQYAVTREEALEALNIFCDQRLHLFGDYEDAIVKDRSQLYHSILSPYINIGLLSPMEVVEKIMHHAQENDIGLNNTEGIIRQIIGWREFIRMVYEKHGTHMRTGNEWHHTRNLSQNWYKGTTGIDPVDTTISKSLRSAYAHHIERLMIMGNIMFLAEIEPQQIYNWFMELYIDAYDWVMVPNVYGMTQSTQKGLMTTKPYISGSNYIKKMSDYKNGPWSEIWDALYWNMIIKNLDELAANGRMHFVTSRAKKFTPQEKKDHQDKAKEFLKTI